jgi:hypothetical protein
LSLDTKSKLGVLKSRRPVVVIGPQYQQCFTAYYKAQRSNSQKQMAEIRAKLIAIACKTSIKPGARCSIGGAASANFGEYPGAGKLAANVTWLPGKDFLRVRADVTDRFFAPAGANESPEEGSSVQIFVCPSGSVTDVDAITLVPAGANGTARVSILCGQYGPSSSDKEDCAKRAKSISAKWTRTGKGYTMDARIPWNLLRGYSAGWKALPVDAAINTAAPDGRAQLVMNKLGDPLMEPFIYSALRAK